MLPDCVLLSVFCCKVQFVENITMGHLIVSSVPNWEPGRHKLSELKYFSSTAKYKLSEVFPHMLLEHVF